MCHPALLRTKGLPGHLATLDLSLGRLEAMRDDFDAGRKAIAHARSIYEELGVTHPIAGMADDAADVERLAGNLTCEERERRRGYNAFTSMGAEGFLPRHLQELALCLARLRVDEEALALSEESERIAANDDTTAQVPWRLARAIVIARRRVEDAAERLVREAVAITDGTDWLNMQGDARMVLARSFETKGASKTRTGLCSGGRGYVAKGNVVSTRAARASMATVTAAR